MRRSPWDHPKGPERYADAHRARPTKPGARGQLAALLGQPATSSRLSHTTRSVRAATFHDYGWLRYETSPLIDAESGEPYPFLQVPMTAQQLASYQWSLDLMADIDPYSGLVVKHAPPRGCGRAATNDQASRAGRYNLTKLSPEVQGALIVEPGLAGAAARHARRQAFGRINLPPHAGVGPARPLFCCQEPHHDFVELGAREATATATACGSR